MDTNWLQMGPKGCMILVQVVPRASKTEVTGLIGDPPRVRIRVASAPVDNAANNELVEFLSRLFSKSKSKIQIVHGEKSKKKDILVLGATASEARSALNIFEQISFKEK